MEHPESDTGYTIQYAKEKPGGTGYDPKPPLPFEIPGTELEVKIDTELFDEARVVACTLVGSANRVMMNRHFTTLLSTRPPKPWKPLAG